MKKILLFLLTLLLFLPFNSDEKIVKASGKFMRVINSQTTFYSDKNGNGIKFNLPYTYYVKVLIEDGDFYHVQCFGNSSIALDGYVKKDELFYDGQEVLTPYLELKIKTSSPAVMYNDENLTSTIQYIFPSRELDYYGHYLSSGGENLVFVGYNGKLGYIKETEIVAFSIPLHPNDLTFLKQETPDNNTELEKEPNNSTNENLNVIRVAVVVSLSFAGLIGLILIMKKKQPLKDKEMGFYDENEYE
jgi:hypothetical protein